MKLVDKYRKWSEKRFLLKHGCATREQYELKYDPDVFRPASRIKSFYHGYTHVYCFEDQRHEIYWWDLGYDGTFVVDKWCRENLVGKYRFDFHRVARSAASDNEWEVNELGGGDYIFFACQDPKDYTLFLLRWS
jgi:hypothetical protein